MTKQQLEAIRKRAEAATEGKWREIYLDGYDDYIIKSDYGNTAEVFRTADAEFIAHAREDVPALLAEIDRLKASLTYIAEVSENFYVYSPTSIGLKALIPTGLAKYAKVIEEIHATASAEVDEDADEI